MKTYWNSRWGNEPCYRAYGVDGSDASIREYLGNVERFCPLTMDHNKPIGGLAFNNIGKVEFHKDIYVGYADNATVCDSRGNCIVTDELFWPSSGSSSKSFVSAYRPFKSNSAYRPTTSSSYVSPNTSFSS
jgi:hypothetical protein